MTIDKKIEEIIESFNPSLCPPSQDASVLRSVLEYEDLLNIFEQRTESDFYRALLLAISAISDLMQKQDVAANAKQEVIKNFARSLLLGVAARERILRKSEIKKIERDCAVYMPFADVLWRELELFESVCRLTDALGIHRPELLQDEQQAWGRAFLRGFYNSMCTSLQYSAPQFLFDSLQQKSQYLRTNRHGVTFQSEPEKQLILDYALRLAQWDDSDIKLSHPGSQTRSRLRNDIRQKLENYATALSSLEVHAQLPSAIDDSNSLLF